MCERWGHLICSGKFVGCNTYNLRILEYRLVLIITILSEVRIFRNVSTIALSYPVIRVSFDELIAC